MQPLVFDSLNGWMDQPRSGVKAAMSQAAGERISDPFFSSPACMLQLRATRSSSYEVESLGSYLLTFKQTQAFTN